MKAFISIPMVGRSDAEVKREMNRVSEFIKQEYGDNTEILDSFVEENPPDDAGRIPVWYLSKSIEVLAKAQLAVFAGEWKKARGCMIEYSAAISYNIPVLDINPDKL